MNPISYHHAFLLVAGVGLIAAGCGGLFPRADPPNLFILGPPVPEAIEPGRLPAEAQVVGIRQMRIADYLQSPYIVIRRDDNRITYAQMNRWAAPLEREFSRATAHYLARNLGLTSVEVVPFSPHSVPDLVLQIDLEKFEGVDLGTAARASMVASWSVFSTAEASVIARGQTVSVVENWRRGDFPHLVELLDSGIQRLAVEIAAAIQGAP
jgi:uncharacterized lipoprotein YmbA